MTIFNKYRRIKEFHERCDSHPDHQSGMITNQMLIERLHEEIIELRDFIEATLLPPNKDQRNK